MYYLFGYDKYYPNGGLNDLVGEYDTLHKAKMAASRVPNDFYTVATIDPNGKLLVVSTWDSKDEDWKNIPPVTIFPGLEVGKQAVIKNGHEQHRLLTEKVMSVIKDGEKVTITDHTLINGEPYCKVKVLGAGGYISVEWLIPIE